MTKAQLITRVKELEDQLALHSNDNLIEIDDFSTMEALLVDHGERCVVDTKALEALQDFHRDNHETKVELEVRVAQLSAASVYEKKLKEQIERERYEHQKEIMKQQDKHHLEEVSPMEKQIEEQDKEIEKLGALLVMAATEQQERDEKITCLESDIVDYENGEELLKEKALAKMGELWDKIMEDR